MINFIFLFLITISLLSCSLQNENSVTSPEELLEPQAWFSSLSNTQLLLKTDTILTTDTLIFQADILPSRGSKTQGHWWSINNSIRKEEFAYKWSFDSAGVYNSIFHVIDRFGDTLHDTTTTFVSRPPKTETLELPFNNAASIDARLISGLRFQWASDAGGIGQAQYHFKLTAESCENNSNRSQILDTIIEQAFFIWWKPLQELCPYSWTVETGNSLGFKSNNNPISNFSTKSSTSLSAILLTTTQKNLKLVITQFGGSPQEILLNNATTYKIPNLTAGEYTIEVSHQYLQGFQKISKQIQIHQSELTQLKTIQLKDITAPIITCSTCNNDTLYWNSKTWSFPIIENGSGFNPSKTSIYVNTQSVPWQFNNDSLILGPIDWKIQSGVHTLNILLQDSSANLYSKQFWLKAP